MCYETNSEAMINSELMKDEQTPLTNFLSFFRTISIIIGTNSVFRTMVQQMKLRNYIQIAAMLAKALTNQSANSKWVSEPTDFGKSFWVNNRLIIPFYWKFLSNASLQSWIELIRLKSANIDKVRGHGQLLQCTQCEKNYWEK